MAHEETVQTDLYEILELNAEAGSEEIRRAYFRLAMRYHPDAQGEQDKESIERFIEIQRAYKILTNPSKRAQYDASRRKGRPAAAPAAADVSVAKQAPAGPRRPSKQEEKDARRAFMHAQELLENGMSRRAVGVLRAVLKAVPDHPAYESLLGYAMAKAGERLHTARDLCRRAVEAEPFNPDFHAYLGFVYLKAGLQKTADGCFAEALKWDPNHPLALEHAGGSTQEPPKVGGWFRSLFRRRG